MEIITGKTILKVYVFYKNFGMDKNKASNIKI
jgi:hypothetical protein